MTNRCAVLPDSTSVACRDLGLAYPGAGAAVDPGRAVDGDARIAQQVLRLDRAGIDPM